MFRIYTHNNLSKSTKSIVDICRHQGYDFETVKPTHKDIQHVIPDDITPHVFEIDDGFMIYIGRTKDFVNYIQKKEDINA